MIDFNIIVVFVIFNFVYMCVYNAVHVWSYIVVGAWFYCIEVCYNIMYYFLHFVHVLFVI